MAKRVCPAGQKWDSLLNTCIISKTETTAKKTCPAGQKWDSLLNTCISTETKTTAKKTCPAGQKWDNHTKTCVPSETKPIVRKDCPAGQSLDNHTNTCVPSKTEPATVNALLPSEPPLPAVVGQVIETAPAIQDSPSVMVLSPALWIFVVLATVGSILVLVLWLIIYRRQTRLSSTSEDVEPAQEPLQKTEPPATMHPLPSERNGHAEMLQRAAEAPSPCPHLHLEAQTSSKWDKGFITCKDPAKHAGADGGGGLPACSTVREHRIPLPATELGGTALVTTKTV
ncbi:uncharacterized protein LOC120783744 [Lates japonicus]|uniref:Uncharacterized protein n=1 Tax=Lates japonicus TaxID=270547 RepID=A0AAD3R9V4_LATJO|nr:uncharacterized protein AKAME5_001235800 [Lates japonicus]